MRFVASLSTTLPENLMPLLKNLTKAIIIGSGKPPSLNLLTNELVSDPLIICADGGGNFLYKHNIVPDYLIGDFDSITNKALEFFNNKNVITEQYPCNKSFTDLYLASQKAIALGVKEIVFLGCTSGERIDHLLGNLGVLLMCQKAGIKCNFKDKHNIITLLSKNTEIIGKIGEKFSLLPYTDITNLSIKGAKYELTNYNLTIGDSLTISNEFLSIPVKISFTSGLLLLINLN